MLGLWLLLYPLFHIHGIPMSQRLAMLQPSLSFRFRFRGVRKGLPAAGAAWQRKPGENHEGSGTMSNFTGVNGGFLRKACENHGKSHESQWRKGNLLAGKIVR